MRAEIAPKHQVLAAAECRADGRRTESIVEASVGLQQGYLATMLGGWIADRLLGMERTVLYGGIVVMAGHIALAVVPGLVALGAGALKANASSLLGTLYNKGHTRADGGFTHTSPAVGADDPGGGALRQCQPAPGHGVVQVVTEDRPCRRAPSRGVGAAPASPTIDRPVVSPGKVDLHHTVP
jgi:hypothetical protein